MEYVTDYPCIAGVSQKVIKNFYHQIGKSFEKQTPYKDVQLPEENTFNKSKRIYVTSDNEKIKQNLLLIKETFYLLANMDENEILMLYFYLYLDCTELEYKSISAMEIFQPDNWLINFNCSSFLQRYSKEKLPVI